MVLQQLCVLDYIAKMLVDINLSTNFLSFLNNFMIPMLW